MEWVEATGRSLADALDLALDQLGVDEDEVEYEVLVEPKSGLFGKFGGTDARIRARVKPLSREKPGERRRNRRERGRTPKQSSTESSGSNTKPARSPQSAPSQSAPAGSSGSSPSPTRRRRSSGRKPAQPEGPNVSTQEPTISVDEQAVIAVDFVRGVVDAFETGATVTSKLEDDDVILVDVTGSDLGLLVGPRGATVTALEELVRTVLQRHSGGHGARIHVDVAGYRAKRREALAAFTQELVERVLESGREQVLEPMPAADRKVVHDTVATFDGVATGSEGEEPRRRVVIRKV